MNSRRIGFVVVLCLLVGATAYGNYLINKPKGEEVKTEEEQENQLSTAEGYEDYDYDDGYAAIDESGDYFEAFQADRDNVRTKELEYLSNMSSDPSLDDKAKQEAASQRLELIENMEKEVTIEGLLKSKGYANVAVTVHKGSINVIVDKVNLDSQEVAQILDIAHRESGEPPENIKVMPKS